MADLAGRFDAVVVGAGSAGSAAAWMLARDGLRVALVESRPLASAGPSWINAIPRRLFDAAGVPPPEPPERPEGIPSFTILERDGPGRATLDPAPAAGIDMRRLVDRLHALAAGAGVETFDRASGVSPVLESGRPVGVEFERPAGAGRRRLRLAGRLLVDASGMAAVLRRAVPALAADCPGPAPREVCSAAAEKSAIGDRDGAASFLERHGMRPGATFAWAGLWGGFSTLYVETDVDLRHVNVVTGTIAAGGFGSGLSHLREFRRAQGWIGRRLRAGAGPIPLRRPYSRLAAPGIALVGDAACQVFPAHASGVGYGLLAARTLADAVRGRGDPGGGEAAWAYQSAFHRGPGAALAAFAAFRKMSQSLTCAQVQAVTALGLSGTLAARRAFTQEEPAVSASDVATVLRASLRQPGLAAGMARAGARILALLALSRRYPATPDETALRLWDRAMAAVTGDAPDIGSG
jgi:flavin-dependent dehydrogenase